MCGCSAQHSREWFAWRPAQGVLCIARDLALATFALRWGADGTEGLVVRKQPPGKLLKGAHDVGREYAAMTALRDTDVPVPNARLFCEDTEVLGTQCFAYIRLRAGPLLQRSVPDGREGH